MFAEPVLLDKELCLKYRNRLTDFYYSNMKLCSYMDSFTYKDECEQLVRTYNGPIQFRILHHDHNRGLSASRNTGTDAATGDYIYYLDSDDYISPDCIERLASAATDNPEIEMVQGNSLMSCNGKEIPLYRKNHSIKT